MTSTLKIDFSKEIVKHLKYNNHKSPFLYGPKCLPYSLGVKFELSFKIEN